MIGGNGDGGVVYGVSCGELFDKVGGLGLL